uniref:Uncharacterized protein n=1 Tax=Vitis vinifera TaxID=29760 RepID=A5ARF1_VITVI|nr:hypothetical protein VITISV_021941 [Vitis vinifera]
MAGDIDSRKSTIRYVYTLGGTAVNWISKLQKIVTLSTIEAKLIEQCVSGDPSQTPTFASVIAILEEVSMTLGRPACPVC